MKSRPDRIVSRFSESMKLFPLQYTTFFRSFQLFCVPNRKKPLSENFLIKLSGITQAFPALSGTKEQPDTGSEKKFARSQKKEQKALTCRKKYVIIYER